MEKAQAGVGGEPCRGVGMEFVGGQSELCLRFPGNGTSSYRRKRKQMMGR